MRKTACWIAAAAVIAIALTTGPPAVSASVDRLTDEELMDTLQESAFQFFWNEANPSNGLIRDRSASWAPCSIASVGFGLSAICIGIDHGWITREEGRERVLTTLETFWTGPQGTGASGYIGYKGLFYHFLDMNSATRVWDCEVSTIDSALLFAGMHYQEPEYIRTWTSLPADSEVEEVIRTFVIRQPLLWFDFVN